MIFLTNLLVAFACNFCAFGGSSEEAPSSQTSILEQVEPGLLGVYDSAKIPIKE